MTSRERVLKAIKHEEPDMVPIDLGAMRSTGIMAIAYNKLKRHLGFRDGNTRIYDIGQQLAEPESTILQRFEVDVIDLANSMGENKDDWKPWPLPDGSTGQVHHIFYPKRKDNEWV